MLQFNLIPLRDLARGLDLRSAESNVADGYCEDLQNVDNVSSGQLAKRRGYQGYGGYVPFRVREVSHDGYQINFKLTDAVNLTGLPSSPILVYGKFSASESGDFSTTAALRSYPTFSVDVRDVFSPGSTTALKSATDTGATSADLFVFAMTSTSEADASNSYALLDNVAVNASTFATTVTYVPAQTERVYLAIIDKAAVGGSSYVADYSASPITSTLGVVSGTITAATHGLGNFNIISKMYTLSAGVYTEFTPDTFTVDSVTGDVAFSFTDASNFDGIVVLAAAAADNFKQTTAGSGATATIVVSTLDTNFPYWALYRLNSGLYEETIPDSVVVDATAGTMTVTITNASVSNETYVFYYDFATILANTVRVVDTSATSTSYTGTTLTDPELTIWGIRHAGLYTSASDRGGELLHLDSYKREAEGRLVCGLGGNLYAARTYAEVGTTYDLAQLTVDLESRIASNASLAPLFQPTGTVGTIRTRGIITGDNVSAGYAVVTSAAYVSSGVVDYTLSLTNMGGVLALNTQVATTDYLTVRGLANSVHTGSWKVLSVPTQTASTVTLRVTNANVTMSDWDEAGAAGQANVYTDNFTVTVAPNYIVGDVIQSASISSALALTVSSVASTTVTVSGVTEWVALSAGLSVFGERTSYVQPLKNSASAASVTGLVRGDLLTLTQYQGGTLARQPRVTYLNPFHDMTVALTVSAGTATVSLGGTFTVSGVNTGTDTFTTSASHGFASNDPVVLATSGALPAGLRSDVVYYVSVQSGTTFKLLPKESGTVIDLTTSGSGTITVSRVHGLSVGQRVTLAQTGDPLLDGVQTVVSVPSSNSFTYTTTSQASSATGVYVGRTAEFDESLTFTDALSTPTTATVAARWVPVESPTVTGNLPKTTYVHYFADTDTNLRSCIVGSNMYFINQTDQVMKFDGDHVYQAGLFRWQPALFAQVDTGTASLVLDGTSAAGTANCQNGNVFTLTAAADAGQFRAGDRVIHTSADDAVYTVQYSDTTAGKVYVTSPISSGDTAWTLKKVKTYKYYHRLNVIDANNNVIASAATGAIDLTIELSSSGQIHQRLVGMPVLGIYDYDRIELETYRTIADTAAPFYKVRSTPVTFSAAHPYIDIYDGTTDDVLQQSGNLDSTMTALLGAELGTAWDQPPRAKYLCSSSNRLVLANIKDYQQLDVVFRKQAGAASVTAANLAGFTMLFKKDATDSGTSTDMINRVKYEFLTSGQVTITPATDIAATSTNFTVTKVAHGLSVGNWIYAFQSAVGTTKKQQFTGWWQVATVPTADTFTVNFANGYTPGATDFDRYVFASTKTNVPVWLGTDGNHNTKYGNTSGSYEFHAALRLANAVNATMTATDTTLAGQSTFVPWLTANAGSEYQLGQINVRQTKYASATFGVVLGTVGSNYDVYVNNVKRATAAAVSATSLVFPSRVVISYENHPETFDAPFAALQSDSDSVVDVNSADGEEITGVIPFFGSSAFGSSSVETLIIVFKTNSIYLLDVATRKTQKIDSQGLGCTAPYSIAPTRDGIMFANLSGIYRLNRNLTVSYVGKHVERYWRDSVNASYISVATGHNYGIGRQYKLSVPTGSDATNSVVLVYDYTREGQDQEFGAWTKYTNHAATGWCNLNDDSFYATTNGQVYKVRSANDRTDYRDDAAAVAEMIILLKALDAGLPGARKSGRSVVTHMRMDKSSVTGTVMSAAVENSETFETIGTITSTLGTKKIVTFLSSLPTPRFVYLSLKYTNSVKDENFVLAGVDLLAAALSSGGMTDRTDLS